MKVRCVREFAGENTVNYVDVFVNVCVSTCISLYVCVLVCMCVYRSLCVLQ